MTVRMNDENLNLENLLNDDSFINWVLYNEDSLAWENRMSANPDNKEIIEKASQLVLEFHHAEQNTPSLADEDKVWSRIHATMEEEPTDEPIRKSPSSKSPAMKVIAYALATFLLILVFRTYYPSQKSITYRELVTHAEKEDLLEEKVNTGKSVMRIVLEDGSVVTLGQNSKVSYPHTFHRQKREVFLSGAAFFEVTKDSSRPFYVYANETVTKVLGTSFEITAFESEKNITVNVRTGRVSVYKQSKIRTSDPETSGLVLLPNQKVTFDRDTESLVKNLVAIPIPITPISIAENKKFDDVPVTEVFKELEKRYGVKILFDQELLSTCIISTSLHNNSLYDNLDVICQTIGGNYKEVDAQIVIESKGCI